MVAALRSLVICVPALCLSGCSWFPWLVCNAVGEPVESVESFGFCAETHHLACQTWRRVIAEHPDAAFSQAYADGFHAGFYDYVTRDRTTEPPPTPPFCYRYPICRSEAQQQDIADWYAGFHNGATVAQEENWRDGVVVPFGRPPLYPIPVFNTEVVPVGSPIAPQPTAPTSPTAPTQPLEEMPAPKPVEPPAVLPPPPKTTVRLLRVEPAAELQAQNPTVVLGAPQPSVQMPMPPSPVITVQASPFSAIEAGPK
jgi:hypothetical protein